MNKIETINKLIYEQKLDLKALPVDTSVSAIHRAEEINIVIEALEMLLKEEEIINEANRTTQHND